jgi:hypothetical protein
MSTPSTLEDSYQIRDSGTGWAMLSLTGAIISRLAANYASLGLDSADQILISDEDPKYMDLPMIGVCPLAEGQDQIHFSNNVTENEHRFPVSLYGAYKSLDPVQYPTECLVYAGRVIDLFSNRVTPDGSAIAGTNASGHLVLGEVQSATLEIGVFRVTDYWIPFWVVKLTILGEL